jgi:muramoyltetrapeptide carboxypeptidase LdcA involved in peptidoglycan recycling
LLTSEGYEVVEIYKGPDSEIQSSITNLLDELRTTFSNPSVSVVWATIGGTTFT